MHVCMYVFFDMDVWMDAYVYVCLYVCMYCEFYMDRKDISIDVISDDTQ